MSNRHKIVPISEVEADKRIIAAIRFSCLVDMYDFGQN